MFRLFRINRLLKERAKLNAIQQLYGVNINSLTSSGLTKYTNNVGRLAVIAETLRQLNYKEI